MFPVGNRNAEKPLPSPQIEKALNEIKQRSYDNGRLELSICLLTATRDKPECSWATPRKISWRVACAVASPPCLSVDAAEKLAQHAGVIRSRESLGRTALDKCLALGRRSMKLVFTLIRILCIESTHKHRMILFAPLQELPSL